MALRWPDPAIEDLQGIHACIAQASAEQVVRVVRTLMRAAEGLVTLPFVGHASTAMAAAREPPLSRWPHTLIYRVLIDRRAEGGDADIAILRVLGPGQLLAPPSPE